LESAATLYREVLSREPTHGEALHLLGMVAMQQGDLKLAVQLHERALAVRPDTAAYHYHLGLALQQLAHYAKAADAFRRAARLQPGYAEAEHSLGLALAKVNRHEEAIAAHLRALQANPQLVAARTRVGELYRRQGDFVAAEKHLRDALAADANQAAPHQSLGMLLQETARFEEAEGHLRKAIALEPQAAESYLAITVTKRYTDVDADVVAMEDLLNREGVPGTAQAVLHYGLGKVYDDLNRYESAFRHYQAANELTTRGFPIDQYRAQTRRLIHSYDRAFFVARTEFGSRSSLPVFLVGMPRAGSSLVEQILANHPGVQTWGERRDIARYVVELPQRLGGGSEYPECLDKLTPAAAMQLAQAYLSRLPTTTNCLRAVDRTSLNFRHLGLIALLFPNAKIIHCKRHPLDTCLSAYFQYFREGYPYVHDLFNLGQFYREYERLMEHWRKVLPLAIHEVNYEDLVRNPESTSRKLVQFCGLDWTAECLRFYQSNRPVQGASCWQVRQPIYRRSLGRWKHYERFLGPLKESLGFSENA
jgi:tetratricopeptide (TPR) repeat protein